MRELAVLTTSGTDRVGIVNDFTAKLLEFSCNIEESRMTTLGGEFAMIMLVSGEHEDVTRLLDTVRTQPLIEGFDVTAKLTGPQVRRETGRPYRIESVSLDNPGIVHAVTALLQRHGISVDDLETETSGAPFTGAPMFHVNMTVIVPEGVSIAALRRELSEVADDHDLDLSVRPFTSHTDE